MIKRFCDVCSDEIDIGSMYVKVNVIGENGVNIVMESHFMCLNAGNLRNWLMMSDVGKVELISMYEGDEL